MENTKKRFVVPLLVVIIIILVVGIYVHDQLAVNHGRLEARDALAQSELAGILTRMQTYYHDLGNNSYIGFCNIFPPVVETLAYIQTAVGIMPTCNVSTTAVAASYPLFVDGTKFWCVDSTGFSGQTAIPLGSNTICPK